VIKEITPYNFHQHRRQAIRIAKAAHLPLNRIRHMHRIGKRWEVTYYATENGKTKFDHTIQDLVYLRKQVRL
jgi:hypothetical protein